jgi:hypothetical protein
MFSFFLMAAFLAPAFPEAMPVAMVLEIKGTATVKPARGGERRATRMLVLAPGDRLIPVDKAEVTIVFLHDGHQERIGANTEATVERTGCKASVGIERLTAVAPKPVKDGLQNLKENERGAAKIFRSSAAPGSATPHVTPFPESKVVSDRPRFTWSVVPGAKEYVVQLVYGGSNRPAWVKAQTVKEVGLDYPSGEKALTRGRKYHWTVLAQTEGDALRKVAEAEFSVATEAESAALAELKPLEASEKPADLLLAALAYHNAGVYGTALALFDRQIKLLPKEPMFHAARAEYLEQSGRAEEAKAAWEKARELGYVGPGEKESPR